MWKKCFVAPSVHYMSLLPSIPVHTFKHRPFALCWTVYFVVVSSTWVPVCFCVSTGLSGHLEESTLGGLSVLTDKSHICSVKQNFSEICQVEKIKRKYIFHSLLLDWTTWLHNCKICGFLFGWKYKLMPVGSLIGSMHQASPCSWHKSLLPDRLWCRPVPTEGFWFSCCAFASFN